MDHRNEGEVMRRLDLLERRLESLEIATAELSKAMHEAVDAIVSKLINLSSGNDLPHQDLK